VPGKISIKLPIIAGAFPGVLFYNNLLCSINQVKGGFRMVALTLQKIIKNLRNLDTFQLEEVLDFVEFIQHKQGEKLPDLEAIDAIYGKYKNRVSSSVEFAQRKAEEIEREEKKWQMR
jgi:hypothetical protein